MSIQPLNRWLTLRPCVTVWRHLVLCHCNLLSSYDVIGPAGLTHHCTMGPKPELVRHLWLYTCFASFICRACHNYLNEFRIAKTDHIHGHGAGASLPEIYPTNESKWHIVRTGQWESWSEKKSRQLLFNIGNMLCLTIATSNIWWNRFLNHETVQESVPITYYALPVTSKTDVYNSSLNGILCLKLLLGNHISFTLYVPPLHHYETAGILSTPANSEVIEQM